MGVQRSAWLRAGPCGLRGPQRKERDSAQPAGGRRRCRSWDLPRPVGAARVPGCCGGACWPRALNSWTLVHWASLEIHTLAVFALDGGVVKALLKRGCNWLLCEAGAGERGTAEPVP
ncbi:hypothetical protein NDU88_004079 [Pleurodeles waltl]|uniref:Uncharacterized protein n=1 Tax=Pleurodeles waltl TaxID=8319 RepID=A0AAV7W7Z8_PLEWA|nr:hypothetical protein NDU88_004079 [Pleurodeles waltl]